MDRLLRATRGIVPAILVIGLSTPLVPAEERTEVPKVTLRLPVEPHNYADIRLPEPFQSRSVRRLDNTPDDNPITNAGATLGRVLFYDTKLSVNNKIACASCHLQKNAFADPRQFSVGHEGRKTDRNAMSLVNSRYNPSGRFFWDERAATLEDQVLMPIQSTVEMGHDLDDLSSELSREPHYPALFEKAFGDPRVTKVRMAKALAQFVRSMVSYQSKYDEGYAEVDSVRDDFPNFSKLENEGKQLYFGSADCSSCHNSNSRRRGRSGRQRVVFYMEEPKNNGIDGDFKVGDGGVADVTLVESLEFNRRQMGLFKSPSLRNVELTAPYMHDGRFATLEEVVDHYAEGVKQHPNLDRELRGRRGGRRLRGRQKTALVAFLKTLTDQCFIADPKFSNPFKTESTVGAITK